MKTQVTELATRARNTFAGFTLGQKVTAIIGTLVLVIAGGLIFRWASTPTYATLFANLAPADASAVVDKLNSDGTPYQLSDGGATVLVPQDKVYAERIKLSGAGLPSSTSQGYSLLDKGGLSTSSFEQDVNFKRAMEGELEKTIESIDGVTTATVLLSMPQQDAFSTDQGKTTASVLVATDPGSTLTSEQVQAIVHLVASSTQNLDPNQVTVTDAHGDVLSSPGTGDLMVGADSRDAQVQAFEQRETSIAQAMLDRVYGPGNAIAKVTADLNFDTTATSTTRYFYDKHVPPLSSSTTSEKYTSPSGATTGGVVGPSGQLTPGGTGKGTSKYDKSSAVVDNSVGKQVEHRVAAPGSVQDIHVSAVLDSSHLGKVNTAQVQGMLSSALGINTKRGDSIDVSAVAFDHSAEAAAAKAVAAQKSADSKAQMYSMLKTGGLVLLVLFIAFAAWVRSRKRNQQRTDATRYVVEQLRVDALARADTDALSAGGPTGSLALESGVPGAPEPDESEVARNEIAALIERQPEEVAQLLRGWLVNSS
ncbi:MAG: flagellar basal-body MS-ring/collar protein FliF [Nocardioidaceae bacterium]